MSQPITLKVNGSTVTVGAEADTPLIYILRNDLGLKAVKFGCGLEQCGACKIIIDGQAVPSCKLPLAAVEGCEITTLENLGAAGQLHLLQQSFVDEQAIQCGFCIAGILMSAKALLDKKPRPSETEIRQELAINLCRCGTHGRILEAVKRVAGLGDTSTSRLNMITDSLPLSIGSDGLPSSLSQNPDLDSWVRINTDGTATLFTGKVEIGQGIRTAVAQIGAEELDVSLDRIIVAPTDTIHAPNEGYSAGSNSLQMSGNAMRYAAAEARQLLLELAAEQLETSIDRLTVTDGRITDPVSGRQTTYWELFGGRKFGHKITGIGSPKVAEQYTIVGTSSRRLDLLGKVTGQPSFVHDMELPDMVHGRVVRPPNYHARLVSVNEDEVRQMPGVLKVVRDGSFLGVIAEREEQAVKAMEALRAGAVWRNETEILPHEQIFEHLQSQPTQDSLIKDGEPVAGPIPAIETPPDATQTVTATYYRPFQMHASIGPSAAVAYMNDGQLTVWTHNQGVYPLRASMAQVMGLDEAALQVIHVEGPGCYGHNGADDAALDAALLARALSGRPVMLKWMRWDEHAWEPYSSAMVVQTQASLDDQGQIVDWNYDVWSHTHSGRPRHMEDASNLLAAWHLAEPLPPPPPQPGGGFHNGEHRNADALYSFPKRRVVKHFAPDSPVRLSSMRGLGAYANVFAIESFMDELAQAAGIDPVEFRLRHLTDERAQAVIQAAARQAGWQPRARPNGSGSGRGVAFARYKNQKCYAAVIIEVQVDQTNGRIHLERAVIAADAGQVVNPDGLANQLEGGLIQAASWTLKEAVTFNEQGITSVDWQSYPILTFPDVPDIETVLLNRPGVPFLGAGEATQGPTPAAIANAVFDAVGVRLREIPFTPDKVREFAER